MDSKNIVSPLDVAVHNLRELNQRNDFFSEVAAAMKNHFDALVKTGFTEEQAIRIVAGFASKSDK